ncbi:hypothetical protein BH11ACT5_BH11ACT5_15090 [soil metagenome]
MTSPPPSASAAARVARILRSPLTWVVVAFLTVSLFGIVTLPWKGTADAYDHLDYVFQVWSGHLPQPLGHEWRPAGWVLSEGQLGDGRQFASAHPPLYYLVAAAVAGGLLDSDQWRWGVLVLRLLNTAIGLGGVFVLAWAGSVLGGRYARVLRVALPAAGAFSFCYLRFSTDTYNDVPVSVLSMIAVVLGIRLLQVGFTWRTYLLLVLACTAGMGTKATFALTLAAACVAVAAGFIIHARSRGLRTWGIAAALAGGVAAAPLAAFGWFYLRNIQLSGDWYRSYPKSALGGRSDKSLFDNLRNPDFYGIVPQGLIGRGTAAFASTAELISLVIFVVGAVIGIAVVVRRRKQVHPTLVGTLVVLMLALHLVGSYVLQLSHATGYGAYNWRYFLPSTITIALLVIGGAAVLGRASAWAIPAFTIALWSINAYSFVIYGVGKGGVDPNLSLPRQALGLAEANGFPAIIPALALAVAAVATVLMGVTLRRMLIQPLDEPISPDASEPSPQSSRPGPASAA